MNSSVGGTVGGRVPQGIEVGPEATSSPSYTVPHLSIVVFVITVGNNILHCVLAVTTVVTMVLRK